MTLLDTHALIWLSEGSARLGPRARSLADRALAEGTLAVSAISFCRVTLVTADGRIRDWTGELRHHDARA